MTSHDQRLKLLAEALQISDLSQVVSRLRSRDVMYFGAGGALLFATRADWSDERIVEAAFQLFVVEDTKRASTGRFAPSA